MKRAGRGHERTVIVLITAAIIAVACLPDQQPTNPLVAAARLAKIDGEVDTIVTGNVGTEYTYRVQAFTSRNGQIESVPSCLVMGQDTSYHFIAEHHHPTVDTLWLHMDVRKSWRQNGTCNAPSPYNGGWINVYEVDEEGEHLAGQVNGDMVYRDFVYKGPGYKTIKLQGVADATQYCQVFGQNYGYVFLGFDNHGSYDTVTVAGQGDLRLGQFACPP